jgi:hypothetical protein
MTTLNEHADRIVALLEAHGEILRSLDEQLTFLARALTRDMSAPVPTVAEPHSGYERGVRDAWRAAEKLLEECGTMLQAMHPDEPGYASPIGSALEAFAEARHDLVGTVQRHTFVITTAITLSIEVEADSLEGAIEKARESSIRTLCHQCAGASAGEWATSGEIDGDPHDADVVDYFGPSAWPDVVSAWNDARGGE